MREKGREEERLRQRERERARAHARASVERKSVRERENGQTTQAFTLVQSERE